MRTVKFMVIGMALFLAGAIQAQVSVNVHIGAPPPWGPAGVPEVRYYYLPDVEAYYDVQTSMFIYFGGGVWVHRANLPSQFRNYDLYGGYKVVMKDYHGNTPYNNFKEHKRKWGRGYHGEAQRTIGERPGKGNPGGKNSHEGNHDNKSGGHGNDKNMKEDHGHGDGNGKKK
ncbi:MAG: hypothetical protein NTX61_16475 [Bacteroidetes bacterium]|nr:hypothetical protein [Bacteroidota bacterium]